MKDPRIARTAMRVTMGLQAAFNNKALHVAYTPNGEMFGVTSWESYEPVDDKIIKHAQKELASYGYNDVPVKALPGAKGAHQLEWKEPDVLVMRLR